MLIHRHTNSPLQPNSPNCAIAGESQHTTQQRSLNLMLDHLVQGSASQLTQAQTADAVTQMQVSASLLSPIPSTDEKEVQPLQSSSSAFDVNDAEILNVAVAASASGHRFG